VTQIIRTSFFWFALWSFWHIFDKVHS